MSTQETNLKSIIKIETPTVKEDFIKHIEIEHNKRILFSAPFGTGKSTFLDDFSESNKDNYSFIKLYPVNYSIASNESIFELIKYDVLYELLTKFESELDLKDKDYDKWLKLYMFSTNELQFMPTIHSFLGFIPKIGKPTSSLISNLQELYKSYKKYSKDIKTNEKEDIENFLEMMKYTKGNLYEADGISQFIFDLVKRLSETQKKVILVVDDLDRLDPDHIFRLFNIFSVHHQYVGNREINKFGFDKVIFVCDIENIREIYKHKYGANVDFTGYIDKFYSLEPYDFDNRKYVKESIKDIIENIKSDGVFRSNNNNGYFDDVLASVLSTLIENKMINLRMLLKNTELSIPNINTVFYDRNISTIPIVVFFYLLKKIVGSFYQLESIIKEMNNYPLDIFILDSKNNHENYHDVNHIISMCIEVLIPRDEVGAYYTNTHNGNMHELTIERYNMLLKFRIGKGSNPYIIPFIFVDEPEHHGKINSFDLLIDAFNACKEKGYFN